MPSVHEVELAPPTPRLSAECELLAVDLKLAVIQGNRARIQQLLCLDQQREAFHVGLWMRLQTRVLEDISMTLQALAYTDELTQLLNRRGFMRACMELLAALEEHQSGAIVFFIDIDGLKRVNDSLGHHRGDEILRRAAGAIRAVFHPEGVLGRLGGDEFAVLMPAHAGHDAGLMAERLRLAVERDNAAQGTPRLSLSVGSAVVKSPDARAMTECLRRADAAMYGDKMSKILALESCMRTPRAI